MKLDPAQHSWNEMYRFISDAVQPRPIAWVSTVSAAGVANLAPFSFFNAVCARPPILTFAPMRHGRTGAWKDTLNNIRETREYVIAIVPEHLVQRMNQSSFEYPPEVSEFEAAGLERSPAERVKASLVAASPVNFECKLREILEFGNGPGGGALVIGEIVLAHGADQIMHGLRIAHDKLATVGRMGGSRYAQTKEATLMIPRPTTGDPLYAELHALMKDSTRPESVRLQLAIEALHEARPRHQWTGIYLLHGDMLDLGPFVGPPTEHSRIPVGKGLCGQAIANDADMDVGDVNAMPGYLACSISTRSEAIVLIRHQGKVVGQIDIDSETPGEFGEEAMRSLKVVAEILAPLAATVRDA